MAAHLRIHNRLLWKGPPPILIPVVSNRAPACDWTDVIDLQHVSLNVIEFESQQGQSPYLVLVEREQFSPQHMRHWLPVAAMAMPSHSQPGTIRFLAQLYCPITECAEMRAENNPMANSTTGRTKCHKKRLSTYLDLCCARPICQHVRWVTLASSSLKSCGKVNCRAPPRCHTAAS